MARKAKGGGKGKARASAPARAVSRKAKRLPSGSYAWKGKAIPFSRLPRSERDRIRSGWGAKAAKARAKAKAPGERKAARAWLDRRTRKLGIQGDERYRSPADIAGEIKAKKILAIREKQRAAHVAWVRQGKHGGGHALIIAEGIRDSLGAELAAAMPQLWWYH